eukprot:12294431-Heterocapsa_arctica.AAC.1
MWLDALGEHWPNSSKLLEKDNYPGSKDVPRLFRSGEIWAESCAKAVLRDNRISILKLMIKQHQYGVAIPGGSEALFHGRATIEEVAKTGAMGELAIIGVDLVNCFGLFEWPSIRDAYASLLPELLPWDKWRQAEQSP